MPDEDFSEDDTKKFIFDLHKDQTSPLMVSEFSGVQFLSGDISLKGINSEGFYQKIKITADRTGLDKDVITYTLINNTVDYLRVKVLKIKNPRIGTFLNKGAYQKELLVAPGPNQKVTLIKVRVKKDPDTGVADIGAAEIDLSTELIIQQGKGIIATHGLTTVYKLPYKMGEKYEIVAAFGDAYHTSDEKYSADFKMPLGQEVCAARGGTIIDIVRKFPQNPPDPHNAGFFIRGKDHEANNILIRHSDDTYGFYTHLKQNGIKSGLKVGSKVNAGDVIGYVGVTGNSAAPHLHFSVQNGGLHSIPWQFQDASSNFYSFKKGECYEAQKGKGIC